MKAIVIKEFKAAERLDPGQKLKLSRICPFAALKMH
jgi:hypothetical protein